MESFVVPRLKPGVGPGAGPRTGALYAVVVESAGYVVGEANASSGLFRREDDLTWTHLGWHNVRAFGLDFGIGDTLYLACGNGVHRSLDAGDTWRVTTDWLITEVLDVTVDPRNRHRLWIATAYGVWSSVDGADTWMQYTQGLPHTFTQSVACDKSSGSYLVAGSELGIARCFPGGAWSGVGPEGVAVRCLEQSTEYPDHWLAGTEDHGLFRSIDGALTWAPVENPALSATMYACAIDPDNGGRQAAAGFLSGVYVTFNDGVDWTTFLRGFQGCSIHALCFDPIDRDIVWVGTVEKGVHCLFLSTGEVMPAGLPDANVRRLVWRREPGEPGDTS